MSTTPEPAGSETDFNASAAQLRHFTKDTNYIQAHLFNVNYFCRLASIILAGSPPYPAPAAGPLRSGSWGR